MIALVDYGVGNLFSLKSSFSAIGKEVNVTGDPEKISSAEKIVLPGVGAFGDASDKLRTAGLDRVILDAVARGIPILGICLGMQLLFEESCEYGYHKGLGLLKGKIVPIEQVIDQPLKIPHMGWNALHKIKETKLLKYTNEGDHVYFVHSYCAINCEDSLAAVTDYAGQITALVSRDNVHGCQFHPEKSGKIGLNILKAFCEED